MRRNQRTIKSPFEVSGAGLHSGAEARVRVVPAELGDDVGLIGTVPLVASALPGWRTGGHAANEEIPAIRDGARSA